jgi:hypothetical protein
MTTEKPVPNAESKQIDEYLKRPALYRNVDGTEEINMGIMGLGVAAMLFVYPAHAGSVRGWAGAALIYIYLGILAAIVHFGSKAVKKRLTYPRTGFAEPRCTNRGGKWAVLGAIMLASAVFGAVVSLSAFRRPLAGPALVSCGGLIVSVAFATGIGKRVPWKQWVAAILAVGAVAIAFLPPWLLASAYRGVPIPRPISPAMLGALCFYLAWMGVVFLTSGLITLRQYIGAARPVEPDAE